ncbi:N-acetylmuramoyl-L-alanine amidase [Gordonia sp. HY002]|uniref:N-acetylmuramoyl-L-alanine amidase n=1 Tax=Gordonia zhenghanii TaxID=2911516 RepID=UPI001EF14FE0|nr:N-acetylmuramoyl-L-alanine amidase [Gordonia zhenghanii]MCF8571297.1 N-acetylmuramoyl-L-alanine amidase [Gordonia zhenghanii]MCF8601821.1 N-acetylmuramoyl-L-alanine amidase [Gordonia zhenghanii]
MNAVRARRGTLAAASLVATAALSLGLVNAPSSEAAPLPGAGKDLAGKTIFLDPGHQGSAAGHDLNKQVPDGRGGKKACQTTGATAVTGKAEHTVNWEVSQLVKAALESKGARVVLSRKDDTGWGGCVDERAEAASRSGAAVAVSLHADSTSKTADNSKSGFHLIVPTLPLPDKAADKAQASEGRKASNTMRDALVKAGLQPAGYAGAVDGIQTRADIAGVNLTRVPAVFVEMGNLSNPAEAKSLSSPQGAAKYAMAITDGITSYVDGKASSANPTAPVPAPGDDKSSQGVDPREQASPESDDSAGGVDLAGLAAAGPLFEKIAKANSPQEAQRILMTEGQDVSAEVLKAMLSVVYAVFGGKLPV